MSELPFLPPYLLLVQETQERLRCSEERLVLRDKGFLCSLVFFFLYPYLFVHLFRTFVLLLTVLVLSLGAKVS